MTQPWMRTPRAPGWGRRGRRLLVRVLVALLLALLFYMLLTRRLRPPAELPRPSVTRTAAASRAHTPRA